MARSLQVENNAEAAKAEKIALAHAQQAAFLARYEARRRLSIKQEVLLQLGALESGLRGQAAEDVEREYARQRAEMLKQQADQWDFRLYWEMLGSTLFGREKVIIDAEKVPGRRHLFLIPLEPFRFMLPSMPPRRGEEP
jgi:hypothetical protein